jgi:hypothetical protein
LSAHISTPNFQHFDVTFQPDPLGHIDMSNPMAGGKGAGQRNNTNKNIRDWIQKSHESVFLITREAPTHDPRLNLALDYKSYRPYFYG